METTALVLGLAALSFIGLLPWIFFRREERRFGAMWLLTASPYPLAGAVLIAAASGALTLLTTPGAALLLVLGTLAFALSIAGIGLTIGSHRVPLALWHQDSDAPREVVTWGPYAHVRHPFYACFLLAQLGVVCVAPHALSLALLTATFVLLSVTAAREERRLSDSEYGAEYREYMRRTGRFLPTGMLARRAG